MEIKREIEPEQFWEDNYSELVASENHSISFFVIHNSSHHVLNSSKVIGFLLPDLSSFNTSSVDLTTSSARDALKKSFLEYRLIPKSFLIVKLSFLKEACCYRLVRVK